MIYSSKRDFLFIKGKKVAGTSVEMALSCLCGPEDIITKLAPIEELERLRMGGRGAQNYSKSRQGELDFLEELVRTEASKINDLARPRGVYKQHMSLTDFEKRHGCIPTKRIFCIERSPYAKVISAANMAGKFADYKVDGRTMKFGLEDVRKIIQMRLRLGRVQSCLNIERYRSLGGEVRVQVIRNEDLPDSFNSLMEEYGISPVPALPHAKRGSDSNSLDPREVLTREQLATINEVYAEEFHTFGFEMIS